MTPKAEQIKELDCLLERLVEDEAFIQPYDLAQCRGGNAVTTEIYEDFGYYLSFFEDSGAARIRMESDHRMGYYNSNSHRFLKEGGFKTYYANKLKEEQELARWQAIELEKTLVDLDLAKKMLKDYPTTKKLAIAGVIISSLVFLFELVKLFLF